MMAYRVGRDSVDDLVASAATARLQKGWQVDFITCLCESV